MAWTFLDFVNASGQNEIRVWLDGLPKKVKAKVNTRLQHLQAEKVLIDTRYTEVLHGECEGLMEIKIEAANVQYRPLAFYGPGDRQITILFPAEERSDRFEPPGACEAALRKREEVLRMPNERVCPHDYS